jgi:chromate transporter
MNPRERLLEVARVFFRLGLTSFGGPVAHLGYFRSEVVQKRRWLTELRYGELVALAQLLPGPSSSQVVFALGAERAGWLGAALASFCFTLPSALFMLACAAMLEQLPPRLLSAGTHGLMLAAFVVVAQAVLGMSRTLCPDAPTRAIACGAALTLVAAPSSLTQVAVVLVGAALAFWIRDTQRTEAACSDAHSGPRVVAPRRAIASLVGLWATLVSSVWIAWVDRDLELHALFVRAGSLVFGGGHVVLPLLRESLVPRGFLSDARFLSGYALAQVVPGPLFTFAAFLGASISPASVLRGVTCMLALFLPGLLLMAGALPLWARVRELPRVRVAVRGASAAVVGVLAAALYQPLGHEAIRTSLDAVMVVVALGLLELWRAPVLAVVLGLSIAGVLGG